jgi:hypothetical protein
LLSMGIVLQVHYIILKVPAIFFSDEQCILFSY